MISVCLLCQRPLKPISEWRQRHPLADDCPIKLTDHYGVAVDDTPRIVMPAAPEPEPFDIELQVWPTCEELLIKFFKNAGLERLGGISTGHGWSMHSAFQKCNYYFFRKYREPVPGPKLRIEAPALAIGILIHTFLAIYYQRMIVHDYPVTPEMCRDEIRKEGNPELIDEAWRCFAGYALYYQYENIMPLAVEYGLRDPRTGDSCRYDLIAFFPEPIEDRPAGTYVMEHKSAARFDDATLDGWRNDGEVIGQITLWDRLYLERRYGKLRGVIVNIVGKQEKNQKFHRTIVHPSSFKTRQHQEDLKVNEARIQMADATGVYPRSRINCIHRYGKCDFYDHCAGEE